MTWRLVVLACAVAIPYPTRDTHLNGSAVANLVALTVTSFDWSVTGTYSVANPTIAVDSSFSDTTALWKAIHVSNVLDLPAGGWFTLTFSVVTATVGTLTSTVRVRVNYPPVAVMSPTAVTLPLPTTSTTLSANMSTDDESGKLGIVQASWSTVLSLCSTCTASVTTFSDDVAAVGYTPVWNTDALLTVDGPGVTAVTLTVTDAHGLTADANGAITVQWPPLALVLTIDNTPTTARIAALFNDTDAVLATFLWQYNTTQWFVTDSNGGQVATTCGLSSVCWLTNLDASLNYTVDVSVLLVDDVGASPATYGCSRCSYTAHGTILSKTLPTPSATMSTSASASFTPSFTATTTVTATFTSTTTTSATTSATATASFTTTTTASPSATATDTATVTTTATTTVTRSASPSDTVTPSSTATDTATSTFTTTTTASPSGTASSSVSPSVTKTLSATTSDTKSTSLTASETRTPVVRDCPAQRVHCCSPQ